MNRKDAPGTVLVRSTICLGLLGCLLLFSACTSSGVTFFTDNGKVNVAVELAVTNEARSHGLMNRTSLDGGMLFVFDEEAKRTFWMKNTLIPLDMVFVGSDLTINEIKENIPPCTADPCPVYPSINPAQYVIELNAGFAKQNHLKVGQKISIPQ